MKRFKKSIPLISLCCAFSLMLASVSFAQETDTTAGTTETAVISSEAYDTTASVTDEIDLSDPASTEDGCISVDTSDENGAAIISVTEDGTYSFTGSGKNLSIVVKKGVTATIIFDSASIDNSAYSGDQIEAVLDCKASSNVTVQMNGTNTITCNSSNSVMENGIKHNKTAGSALTFTGSGSLTISGTADDGIKYKNGTVAVTSGTLTITDCHGDGIQAEYIDISGGTTNITTTYENASTGYYTSGSSSTTLNTITESGGASSTTTKTERVNVDTGSHKALKAGTKGKSYSYLSVAEEDSETYTAGTTYTDEASGGITISGGVVNIDTTAAGIKANSVSTSGYTQTSSGVYIIGSPDDAVSSNNTFEMTGGELNIASSDDAISSAGSLEITGTSVVNISTCYEGLEGGSVTIGTSGSSTGPEVTVNANDDGINASSKTVSYVYDSSDNEDYNYTKTSVSSSTGNDTVVYSGTLKIYIDSANTKSVSLAGKTISYSASGDGIDCNGALDIEGGTVYVFGQTSGDNSPIDTNSGFSLSDQATILAAGCDSMGESVPASGTGVYLTYTGTSDSVTAQTAGSGNGNEISFSQPGSGSFTPGSDSSSQPGSGSFTPGSDSSGQPGSGSFTPGSDSSGQPGGGSFTPGGTSGTSISAGSVFTVKNGSTVLFSETLPYAASFVLYASPNLTSGTSYTVTTGSDSGSTTGGDSGSTTGGDSGSTTGGDSGSTTGGDSGSTTGGDSGSTTGGDSGSTTGGDSGSTTGDDSGSTTGGDSGTTTGGDSGSTTGGDSGSTTGSDSGSTTGDDSGSTTGDDSGSTTGETDTEETVTVTKVKNTISNVISSKTLKYSKLKSKNLKFKLKGTANDDATLTYSLYKVSKKAKNYITVSKNGKVTVKKGLAKGTYKIRVKVTSSATDNYKKTTVTKLITIKVK